MFCLVEQELSIQTLGEENKINKKTASHSHSWVRLLFVTSPVWTYCLLRTCLELIWKEPCSQSLSMVLKYSNTLTVSSTVLKRAVAVAAPASTFGVLSNSVHIYTPPGETAHISFSSWKRLTLRSHAPQMVPFLQLISRSSDSGVFTDFLVITWKQHRSHQQWIVFYCSGR